MESGLAAAARHRDGARPGRRGNQAARELGGARDCCGSQAAWPRGQGVACAARGGDDGGGGKRQAWPANAGGPTPPSMAQLAAQQCGKVPPAASCAPGEPAGAAAAAAVPAGTPSSATTRGPPAVHRMTDAPRAGPIGAGAPNAVAATSDWKTSSPAASHASARRVTADMRENVTGVCIPMVPASLRCPPRACNFNPTRHNCYAPRFQHQNVQHTMGLEQLAAIRGLLVKQAQEEAASKKKPARPNAGEAASKKKSGKPARAPATERRETPVDPVLIAISRLQRQFPKAFPKKPAPKVPLKLGVLEDLVQHAKTLQLSADEIKQAVKTWCDGRRYWDSMVEHAARVDLNGEPAGAVTANEAQHAKRMASRRHAKAGGGRGGKGNANKPNAGKDKPAGQPAQADAAPAQAEAAAPADVRADRPAPAQAPADAPTSD